MLSLALAAALAAQPAPAAAAPDYADSSAWLCLPGREDPCATPLPTTALDADGYGATGLARPAADPGVDCFYVYPTVSRDPAFNSDLVAGPEEQAVALVQFARFASVCRTFAPLYRQMTLAGLTAVFAGNPRAGDPEMAYGDVREAWRTYLAEHNDGRPFVLIGHSQGTYHLTRLLREEIEGGAAAGRMLSAMLLGFNVEVPQGEVVGGSFRETPLCTRPGQTGCVVAYVSFRASNPPPASARFGRAAAPGMTVACTNPAALGHAGSAPLDSYWFTAGTVPQGAEPMEWSSEGPPPTPFLRTEGFLRAACVDRGGSGYLSVMPVVDPDDARTDRIPGDVYVLGRLQPGWGLHLADVNLALGDLVRIVAAQAESHRAR